MKPITRLPANYVLRGRLDLSKDKSLLLGLSLGGLVLALAFGVLFVGAAVILVPHLPSSGEVFLDLPGLLELLAGVLAITALVVVLHELTHAVFFWLFTHEWPVFGFKGVYAYTAAPNWYIPRLPYVLVGLAPLLLLTLLGLALLRVLPMSMIPAVVFALTINAAGAVGDLYIVFRLLCAPAACLVHDEGNGLTWYSPQKMEQAAEN